MSIWPKVSIQSQNSKSSNTSKITHRSKSINQRGKLKKGHKHLNNRLKNVINNQSNKRSILSQPKVTPRNTTITTMKIMVVNMALRAKLVRMSTEQKRTLITMMSLVSAIHRLLFNLLIVRLFLLMMTKLVERVIHLQMISLRHRKQARTLKNKIKKRVCLKNNNANLEKSSSTKVT